MNRIFAKHQIHKLKDRLNQFLMKKIILMGIFAITVVFATAQTSNRTSAFNYLKKGKLDKAVEYIEPTTTHEKTMNEAKTWFFRGNIYLAIANSDNPEYKKLIVGRNHNKNSLIDGKNNVSSGL